MTDSKIHEILSIRASGHVKRWHTLPHIGDQSVAEHSGQALTLLFYLHPNPSMNLVKCLLWHDSAERECGDMPAPIRRKNKLLASAYESAEDDFFLNHVTVATAQTNLTAEEKRWLKAVDTLELMLWCDDQIYLGNRHAEIVRNRAKRYLTEDTKTPDEVIDFVMSYSPRSFA